MKIWIKYLLGILLGFAASFVLPVSSPQVSSVLSFITELFIRFGVYILIPVILFSVMTASFNLAGVKLLLKTAFWTFLIIVGSSLLLTFIGLLAISFVKLPRIPITVEKLSSVTMLNIPDLIRKVFPYSPFASFIDGNFLLPVFVFAFILGIACNVDRADSRPIMMLVNSFSKICYTIMNFFIELFSIGIIAVMATWTIQFRAVLAQGIFTPLILLLLGTFIFVSFIVYPAVLYFLCHDPRPYRVLYASLASVFTAFLTGNTNITLPVIIIHSKDSLGIQRKVNAFSTCLISIFARGGSALVTVISFILIWRSYSSLNIAFMDLVWFSVVAFALSFTLGSMPSGGTFFALTVLCTMYSRGFETGYLLLRPAAVIIGSFAAAFDAVTAMFGTYIISIKTKQIQHKELSSFI